MTPIRIGFIGVGHRGAAQAVHVERNFSARARIVALADIDPGNLQSAARHLSDSAPETYTDWRQLIERDDLDAVCISTPQFAHRQIAVAAFAAGKHVYCEKPLALTVADCDAMIAAAGKAGKTFVVGQQMRYHHHLERMRRLIDAGEIGAPQLIWLKEFRNPFPRNMAWAFDKSKSGGAIVEKSCHHFDVFTWILGSPPLRVFATGGQAVHRQIFGVASDIVDHAWVIVEHAKGRKAMLGLCFFAGPPDVREGSGTHVRDIGVIGAEGMIVTEGFHMGRDLEVHYRDRPDVTRIKLDPSRGRPDALFDRDGNWGIWVDFFNCIETGAKPIASGEVGRCALAVGLAAEKSIATGTPVEISEVE